MDLESQIFVMAKNAKLDPILVKAIAYAESSCNPKAVRYEKNYRYLFDVKEFAKKCRISVESEEVLQKMSFGLLQIMGAVARERGFDGYLTDLCDPMIGLFWGCKHLELLFQKYKGDDAIAAWNAGSPRKGADGFYENQHYVNRVKSFYNQFKVTK